MNKIRASLEPIKADEDLKRRTTEFLYQEMRKKKSKSVFSLKYAFAVAACFFICAIGIGQYYLLSSPVSYISIDINPSLEISLNRLNRVIKASAYNDDGKNILLNLDLKGVSYKDAVDDIAKEAEKEGYFKDTYSFEISVVSKNDSKLIEGIENCYGYQEFAGACHSLSAENMEEAQKSGLSFGKYRAYLELKKYKPEITVTDCQNMSMRQIRNLIEQAENPEKNEIDIDQGENGNGKQDCNGTDKECGNGNGNGKGKHK